MIPRNYIRILVGDQNAQVGREHTSRHIIEKKSMHSESNNNGLRLISFASTKGLVIIVVPSSNVKKSTHKLGYLQMEELKVRLIIYL